MAPATIKARPYLLSAPGLVYLLALLLVPLIMIAVLSFEVYKSEVGAGAQYTLANYLTIATDSYYIEIFVRTLTLALIVTVICAAIGVPEAYIIHRMGPRWRAVFLLIVLGPLLISVVVRTLGWALILGRNGLLNNVLVFLGVVDSPLRVLYTMTAVVLGLVHVLVPFMIISVWASLQRINPHLTLASASLGANQFTTFRRVILPLALPGMLSGSLIVFALSASSFATPAILGGRRLKVVATAVYDEFLVKLNWQLGAALAVSLFVLNIVIMLFFNRMVERRVARHTT